MLLMKKEYHLIWKRSIGKIWRVLAKSRGRKIILLYHSVGNGPWSMPTRQFEAHVAWLTQNAFLVSLDKFLEADPQVNKPVVTITFDDGYASLMEFGEPVLSRYGAVASVFLSTDRINDTTRNIAKVTDGYYPQESFLSWNDVLCLRSRGWLIGSHGMHHIDMPQHSFQIIQRELAGSKQKIEENTGHECRFFSYPWGRHNKAVRNALQVTGYQYALTGIHAPVVANTDPYQIPRINIHRDCRVEDLISIVHGDWDYLGLIQKAKHIYQ